MSEGRRHPGMEHWLPLFHERLETLFDYVPGSPVVLEPLAEDAARERLAQIKDYYEARQQALDAARRRGRPTGRCRPTGSISPKPNGASGSTPCALARLTPFAVPEGPGHGRSTSAPGRAAISPPSAPSRARNVFEAVTKHVAALQAGGKRVIIALWSEGARERMSHVLADHGARQSDAGRRHGRKRWRCPSPQVALAVLGLESGFETADAAVIGEQDILGDRLVRPRRAGTRGRRTSSPR